MGNREATPSDRARSRQGDLEALMATFHPDAVFTLVGDKRALEVTGIVHGHGHEGVR
jgi:hypothetical protein